MGNDTIQKLKTEALALPEDERAALALLLMRSLDRPVDGEAGQAWDEELKRRVSCVREGTAVVVDREELRKRMEAHLRRS